MTLLPATVCVSAVPAESTGTEAVPAVIVTEVAPFDGAEISVPIIGIMRVSPPVIAVAIGSVTAAATVTSLLIPDEAAELFVREMLVAYPAGVADSDLL